MATPPALKLWAGKQIEKSPFAKATEDKPETNGKPSCAEASADKDKKDINLKDIAPHIIKNALARNEFYAFDSLEHYFPELKSADEFILNEKYLNNFSITFEGKKAELENLGNIDKYLAVASLLKQIETEIKNNLTEYVGTPEFVPIQFSQQFGDKKIKMKKDSERANGQIEFLENKDWYVFNANYGTAQEKFFVEMMDRQITKLRQKYNKIFLVRNERQLKIYKFSDGRAFEPDYLLFLVDKAGNGITYQLFLEPKGVHLAEGEKWKSEFLEEIRERFKKKF